MCNLRGRESGSVIVEASLFITVLVILLFGLVDLGRYYINYLSLTRVAYEGARYASRYAGLYSGMPSGQYAEVARRVTALSERQGFGVPASITVDISTTAPRKVGVNIQVGFTSLFRLVNVSNIRTRQEMQYMY